ncbi:unnamed protein product [Owenia fusiformis]|uniref:Uncharacterized protein n=1 Tax=Owenia fusiformis TaxID=6347 RepID=A0A8J1XSC6_OWEFU|nr:unnamed protein product [Owenia fusiformis]
MKNHKTTDGIALAKKQKHFKKSTYAKQLNVDSRPTTMRSRQFKTERTKHQDTDHINGTSMKKHREQNRHSNYERNNSYILEDSHNIKQSKLKNRPNPNIERGLKEPTNYNAMFKKTGSYYSKQAKNQISNKNLIEIVNEFKLPKDMRLDRFRIMLHDFEMFHTQSLLKVDVMTMKTPIFLSNYKTPCWLAPLTEHDVIPNRQLKWASRMRDMIKHMTPLWIERLRRRVNYKIKCLPYVYLIGFPKCGTTDMIHRLHRHPDVAMSKKEFHWWTKMRAPKAKGNTSLCHYTDLFNEAAEIVKESTYIGTQGPNANYFHKKIIIDGSPSTVFNCSLEDFDEGGPMRIIADDIRHVQGNKSKFIVMLRDPVERLYSEFIFFRKSHPDEEVNPNIFDEMARKGIRLFNDCLESHSLRMCVYKSDLQLEHSFRLVLGIYHIYLRDWIKVVGDDLLPVVLEEFVEDKTKTMTAIFDHLNIERLHPLHMDGLGLLSKEGVNGVKQKYEKYGEMLPETRTLLEGFYAEYNKELEKTLGRKLIHWEYKTT